MHGEIKEKNERKQLNHPEILSTGLSSATIISRKAQADWGLELRNSYKFKMGHNHSLIVKIW